MTQETEKKMRKVYSFEIANNTDEKLYNVPFFSIENDETNHPSSKISYTSRTKGLEYKDLVKEIRESGGKIHEIMMYASGDYNKFVTKQLFCCLESDLFPYLVRQLTLDPYQHQGFVTRTIFDESINSLGIDSQINISYLMPEVKVILHIFLF